MSELSAWGERELAAELAHMSDTTADIIFGAPVDTATESPLFHDKLLGTHFTASLDTAAVIRVLLDEVEAQYALCDAVIAEAVAVLRAAIDGIGA